MTDFLAGWQCAGIDLDYPDNLAVRFTPPPEAGSPFRVCTLHVRDARWAVRYDSGGVYEQDSRGAALAGARSALVGRDVTVAMHQHHHDRLVVAFPDVSLEVTGDPKRSIQGRSYSWVIDAQ